MGMDQYLYIPFLGGWTSIYQLFWCSPGVHGFDPSPNWREKQRQGKQKKQTRKPKKKKNQENKTHTKKKKIWEQPSCCFYVSFVCLLILSCGSCGFVCFFFVNCFSFFLLKSTSSVQAGLFRVIANWVFKTPVDVFSGFIKLYNPITVY